MIGCHCTAATWKFCLRATAYKGPIPSATCFRICFQWQSALEPKTWSSLLQSIAAEKMWWCDSCNGAWSWTIFLASPKLINLDFGTLSNLRAPCLPGAGPCLRQWMRDVSDGAWASNQHAWVRAVQTFSMHMQAKVTWRLHWYIRSIGLRSTCCISNGFSWLLAMESPEDELLDLLTCHRSAPYRN